MAEVIIMPKLGYNMDEGELVKWHKKEGETIVKGETLFEINTDKTTMPVEAVCDGTVLRLMIEEGDKAEVFTPIAVIGNPGENVEDALKKALADNKKKEEQTEDKTEDTERVAVSESKTRIKDYKLTPRAKKMISEEKINPESIKDIKGTGYEGSITSRDIKASPLAIKIAEKKNIDITTVKGTGINGKIMKADVERAGVVKSVSEKKSEEKIYTDPELMISKEEKYMGVRRIIGEKLAESKFTAPHLYFTDEVDTTELTSFRKMLNKFSDVKIAVSDILTMAACKALQRYPEVNASLKGDTIVYYKSINIGTAVAGEKGLVVPVIKNVQGKSLTEVAKSSKDLVARGKEGRLMPAEYNGGTFSISNLGMFGIKNFTAIINLPEAAILSVSSIRKMPVVVAGKDGEDAIDIRPMMNIQLSVDHRIIDGLVASQFIEYIKELLENPIKILM